MPYPCTPHGASPQYTVTQMYDPELTNCPGIRVRATVAHLRFGAYVHRHLYFTGVRSALDC